MPAITRARAHFEERKTAKSLENLPPELLAMIAWFASSNQFRDAAALARVNRRFYDLLIQILYKAFLKRRNGRRSHLPKQDAMQFALRYDRPCTLSRLIEAGAHPSTYLDEHLIYHVVGHRKPKVLRCLLKHGTDVEQPRSCPRYQNSYPLQYAILTEDHVAMKILLKHGADANKKRIINIGNQKNVIDATGAMVSAHSHGSPTTGTGAEPSTELRAPLSFAMHHHNKTALRILLQYGADPKYCLRKMGLLESTGQKFFEWMGQAGSLEIFVAFLEGGIDLTNLAKGICLTLFYMTLHGGPINMRVIKGLLRNGVLLPRSAFLGTSFLHQVLQYVNDPIPLIEAIVDSGQASIHDRDNRDWGTVHHARRNLEVVKWLVERGANTNTSCTKFASVIRDGLKQGYVRLAAVKIILGEDLEED